MKTGTPKRNSSGNKPDRRSTGLRPLDEWVLILCLCGDNQLAGKKSPLSVSRSKCPYGRAEVPGVDSSNRARSISLSSSRNQGDVVCFCAFVKRSEVWA